MRVYYETAVQRNDALHNEYGDLLKDAVLFGRSGDDNYLMLQEDHVYEVSCYVHEIVKRWEHVYLFFYENVAG